MTELGLDLSRYTLGWHDEVDYVFVPKPELAAFRRLFEARSAATPPAEARELAVASR